MIVVQAEKICKILLKSTPVVDTHPELAAMATELLKEIQKEEEEMGKHLDEMNGVKID